MVVTYEARIYVGSREGYGGRHLDESVLVTAIGEFQRDNAREYPGRSVRITPTAYLCEAYFERGWEIGIINYPRFPMSRNKLDGFAMLLGQYLMVRLKQNRVSVVMPDETVLFESEDAEASHLPDRGETSVYSPEEPKNGDIHASESVFK